MKKRDSPEKTRTVLIGEVISVPEGVILASGKPDPPHPKTPKPCPSSATGIEDRVAAFESRPRSVKESSAGLMARLDRELLCASGFREVRVYEKHVRLDGVWPDVVIVERTISANLAP